MLLLSLSDDSSLSPILPWGGEIVNDILLEWHLGNSNIGVIGFGVSFARTMWYASELMLWDSK